MAENPTFGQNLLNSLSGGAAGLLGGVIGTMGSIWQNQQNIKFAKEQMSWNEQMMDKQNQFNVDMFERTNAYNDPSAQLQRLRDAGVNPLFSGLDGTGNATALQSAGVNGYQTPDIGNPGAAMMQALQQSTQMEQQKAQIAQIKESTRGQRIQNDLNEKYAGRKFELELHKLAIDANLNQELRQYYKAQEDYINTQREKYPQLADSEIARNWATAHLSEEEQAVARATYDKILKECDWIDEYQAASIANLYASAGKSRKDTELADFNSIKTVTVAQARSMNASFGSKFAGLSAGGSKYDSTPVMIIPDGHDSDGTLKWLVVSVGLQDDLDEAPPEKSVSESASESNGRFGRSQR